MFRGDVLRPASSAELFDALRTERKTALLAGGTDLVVGLRVGKFEADVVVDIKDVAVLGPGIVHDDSHVRIGAVTTMSQIARDEIIRREFPAVAAAAGVVGSIQIRNRATVAGNVCNASPAADVVPPLLVHDAVVDLLSASGPRSLTLDEFLIGPGRTALRGGEVVAAIRLPRLHGPVATSFRRVTRRLGVDLATVNMCCLISGAMTRLVLGSVGPRAILVQDDSGLLADPRADAGARRGLLESLMAAAHPISDVRAGADYRRAMLVVHGMRAVDDALSQLGRSVRER